MLASNKLVKIEAERALYEKSDSPDYYLRVRISNISAKIVGFDRLQKSPNDWHFPQPFTTNCELAEGDHPAPVNGMHPIFLGNEIQTLEQAASAKFKNGKLPRIAPGVSTEFFLRAPNAKTQLAKSWKSAPLWWQSKSFLPNDNLRSPYCTVSLGGQLNATDGQSAHLFGFRKNDIALRFPVKAKPLP